MTPRSLGTTRIVWGVALSALVALAGHEVWARGRHSQPQAPQTQANSAASTANGRSGRGGRGGPDCPGYPGRGGQNQPPNAGQLEMQWEWWKDSDVTKEVGLRPDQAKKIDDFYSSRVKDIDPVAQEYLKETEALDKMFSDRQVDPSAISIEITKYFALRTEVNRSRWLMLYRIARVLDVPQYAKLQAILDRRIKDFETRCGGGRAGTSELPTAGLR